MSILKTSSFWMALLVLIVSPGCSKTGTGPSSTTGVASVSAGTTHTMVIKQDGSLWGMGWNATGQLGDGTTTDRMIPVQVMTGVASVSAGSYHTMVIKQDGSLWAVGLNRYGEQGDGTTTERSTPVQVMPGVASVSAGCFQSVYEEQFQHQQGALRSVTERVVPRYLDCGNPMNGFARARCPDCGHERLLAFSYKCHLTNFEFASDNPCRFYNRSIIARFPFLPDWVISIKIKQGAARSPL